MQECVLWDLVCLILFPGFLVNISTKWNSQQFAFSLCKRSSFYIVKAFFTHWFQVTKFYLYVSSFNRIVLNITSFKITYMISRTFVHEWQNKKCFKSIVQGVAKEPSTDNACMSVCELVYNINWRDVQRKNVVNNVDMSNLRAPWQNGPYKN